MKKMLISISPLFEINIHPFNNVIDPRLSGWLVQRHRSCMCRQLVLRCVPAYVPTSLASLSPGLMLLSRNSAMRDSATSIERTYQKGAPSESDLI